MSKLGRLDVRGALISLLFLAGIGALMFFWMKSAVDENTYDRWTGVAVPVVILFLPLWGATNAFLVRSGIASEYRSVGKERLGGLIQRRGSVEQPLKQTFLAAVAISVVISVVAVRAAGGL